VASARVVLVTGGTRNIGLSIVNRFVGHGDVVIALARSASSIPGAADCLACDVREPDQVVDTLAVVHERFGRLDVVVNNAGGTQRVAADAASPRFNQRIVELNLLAPMHMAQVANGYMQQQEGGGVIVNIGSVSGLRPSPDTAAYGAAKAGLLNVTKTFAMEWAPKVRVNMVTAGLVATDDVAGFYGEGEALARVHATVPLGRMADPDEVASAVFAMAGPDFAHASGTNVVIDGGGERPPYLGAGQ